MDDRLTLHSRAHRRARWITAVAAMATVGALAAPDTTQAAPAARPLRAHAEGRVIVRFRDDVTARDIARVANAHGIRGHKDLKTTGTRTELLDLPAGTSVEKALAALATDPAVLFVQPDYRITADVTSNDPSWTDGSLWGMQGDASTPANQYGTGAAEAWAAGYTGSNTVVIGVIDEGIQFDHPDLAANIWTNPGEIAGNGIDDDGNGYRDDVYGWDFYNNDNTTYDGTEDDHGTHVAGTIGGVGGNGIGVAGVNWSVKIADAKFLGPNGGFTSGAVSALNYYTALKRAGVNIVATSNSWGGGGADTALQNAIDASGDAGILFVAAAGNNASNNDTSANYPSNYQCTKGGTRGYDCTIAVASITNAGALSSFSNYGATTVDLGAPGSNIYSTVPPSSYATYSGTSMATPHVSGAVALCASINPTLTPKQIRDAITNTAAGTASLSGKTATGGRLDVGAMAQSCAAGVPDNPVTGAPTSLGATAVDDTTVNLTWVDGATAENRYEIERAVSSNSVCGSFSLAATTGSNTSSATVTGLSATTTYCFRVRAANNYQGTGSVSAYSNEATATTASSPTPYVCNTDTYSWVTASTGTRYSLGDDGSASVTLPFTFRSYGTSYTSAVIGSNGFLRFGSGAATAYANTNIPNVGDPNGIVAVWWDDLNQALGGNIYARTVGTAPNRTFVVSWEGVPHYGDSTTAITAQLVLEEATGDIVLQYQDVLTGATASDRGAGATVGVERASGTQGTQISYNSASLSNLTAYRCSTNAISVITNGLPGGTVGTAYSQTLSATGGTSPYTWSVVAGSLPGGLNLDTSGLLSGNPTTAGTSNFTVKVTDSASVTATRAYSIVVTSPPAPGSFGKTAPANNTTSRPRNGLVLTWRASTGATRYEYCYDTSNNNTCNSSWVSVGTATTATINGLASKVSYYWQVRAVNPFGTTNADTGKWWKFTTGTV